MQIIFQKVKLVDFTNWLQNKKLFWGKSELDKETIMVNSHRVWTLESATENIPPMCESAGKVEKAR